MFIGHYQLGSMLPLRLWCVTNAGVPTEPDAAPFVQIFTRLSDSELAIAYAGSLPILDRQRITGYFHHRLTLDSRFSLGRHFIFYTYAIGGTVLAAQACFEIIDGGDAAGSGIAVHFFRQSAADYVLLQTHDGTLKKLRNPEVRNR